VDVVTSGIDVHPETGLGAVVARGPATALSVTVLEPATSLSRTSVDISPDGARVVVATATKLHDLRAADLGGRVTADLPMSSAWQAVAAAGAGRRSVIWDARFPGQWHNARPVPDGGARQLC
jgi:hypothetical protein